MALRISHTLVLTAGIAALIAGCSEAPEGEYVPMEVSGNVSMVAGPLPEGTLHFRLYVLESLDGLLQHPLAEIEDFTSETGSFSHEFEYPKHKGEGLAIHAWLDTDGDGIYCTPSERKDPGGLAWVETVEDDDVELNVVLTENCRAANWFYPPRPE